MRVISGRARGTKLNTLEGLDTRPTGERVKEALFSMIADRIPDSTVLDLFSGCGGLAIEALSRGAEKAHLIDLSPKACDIIRSNLSKTRLDDSSTLFKTDAFDFLKETSTCYDIIFLDPPYRHKLCDKAMEIIYERGLLKEDGIIVCETSSEEEIKTDFNILKQRRYGTTLITLYLR